MTGEAVHLQLGPRRQIPGDRGESEVEAVAPAELDDERLLRRQLADPGGQALRRLRVEDPVDAKP